MLSIEIIRREPDYVRKALESRGEEDPLAKLLDLDGHRRQAITEGNKLRSRRNLVSHQIGQLRSSGQELPQDVVEEMRQVGERISQMEQQARELDECIHATLLSLPNIPRPDVPQGLSEADNVVVRHWGEPRAFNFTPRPHWELGEQSGIIGFQRGPSCPGAGSTLCPALGPDWNRPQSPG